MHMNRKGLHHALITDAKPDTAIVHNDIITVLYNYVKVTEKVIVLLFSICIIATLPFYPELNYQSHNIMSINCILDVFIHIIMIIFVLYSIARIVCYVVIG